MRFLRKLMKLLGYDLSLRDLFWRQSPLTQRLEQPVSSLSPPHTATREYPRQVQVCAPSIVVDVGPRSDCHALPPYMPQSCHIQLLKITGGGFCGLVWRGYRHGYVNGGIGSIPDQ